MSSDLNAELVRALRALHVPLEVEVVPHACAVGDCDHEDADGCLEAGTPMKTCQHCYEIGERGAQWSESFEIQPWPCETAKIIAQYDGTVSGG